MTKEEYERELSAIELRAKRAKIYLSTKYAQSNAQFKIGDIIDDGSGIIEVSDVTFSALGRMPTPCYFGHRLTKKLNRLKSSDKSCIVESGRIKLITKK